MRVNRFVFLNLPILSHGDHLGVTASPQSSFPTGYVTLPVDDKPPPLGLVSPYSKGQGSRFPPFSKHSRHMHPGLSGSRRTVSEVGDPLLVRGRGLEGSVEEVVRHCGSLVGILRQPTTTRQARRPFSRMSFSMRCRPQERPPANKSCQTRRAP